MRVLFVTQYANHFLYFKSIIEAFLKNGAEVKLILLKSWKENKTHEIKGIEVLKENYSNFDFGWAIKRKKSFKNKILFFSRDLASYRHYFFVTNQAQYYQDRVIKHFPLWLFHAIKFPIFSYMIKSEFFGILLRSIEKSFGSSKGISESIREFAPDTVLASPVNMRRGYSASDLEYLKAAKEMKIPTFIPIISWDNLTTKGIFHVLPDEFLVWNEEQVKEAQAHKIQSGKLKIIGAPLFDFWFEINNKPTPEGEFNSKHGIKNGQYVLYLGSSSNIAKDETWIVTGLREALDKHHDSDIRNIEIVVRPHPGNFKNYEKILRPGISLIPKEGSLPESKDAFQLFYDSLYYCCAAINGVNTSGIIDAAILDKPLIGIISDMYSETQKGTQHFRQLLEAEAINLVHNFSEFPEILSGIIKSGDPRNKNRRDVVKRFIRPLGTSSLAGQKAFDEIVRFVFKSADVTI